MKLFCLAFVPFTALVALCTVVVAVPLTSDDSTCYSTSSSPYSYYSTHTNYDDVRKSGTDFSLPGCQATKFYYLSRHGIRYPQSGSYDFQKHRMSRVHSLAVESMSKGTLCSADQAAIKSWAFRMHSHLSGQLADQGRQQTLEAGRRWAKRYPDLVGRSYSSSRYTFQHTSITRTYDTAKALAMGMFNRSDFHMDSVASHHCDSLLLYYTCCEKYRTTVHDQTYRERDSFEDGHVISGMVTNINHRLGLHSTTLSFHDIQATYDTCAFEHSIFSTSPWCAAFSDEDIKILEYWRDLKYYYEFGYGHGLPVVYEQTCDLVKDLIGYFKDTSTTITGKIRVAHDDTLMPFFDRLGVFNDAVKPTATNMAQQSNRQWRSSVIAAFGSNIAFVEYKCGSESKMRVFHNEAPLALPMCPASGCKKSDIMDSVLGTFADSCSFSRICESEGTIIG